MIFILPDIPSICNICLSINSINIVPCTANEEDYLKTKFSVLCTVCLDSLLSFYPITVKKINDRQIYGKFVQRYTKIKQNK